jgi:predicted nucleic acid-binding Zn ribbon protein
VPDQRPGDPRPDRAPVSRTPADGSQPGGDPVSRAREALAAARAASTTARTGRAGRPARPAAGSKPAAAGTPSVPAQRGEPDAGPQPGSPRAARRVRRDDPQALSSAIDGLLDDEGWNLAAATGSVFGRWAQIVGPDLAGHTRPEALREGELTVLADSTAWATQLRLLASQLVHRLNAELGPGTVQRVKVRGPVAADRKPGEWRVRGSRGPRDTYG